MMAPTRMVSIRSSATAKPRAASTVCRVAPKAACVRAPVRMMPTQFGVNPTHALFNSATRISTGSTARKVVVTKAAEGAITPSAPKKENMLVLGALFAGWYAFNIYFNIYNKQILTVFPYPWTNTNFQFLGGTVIALLGWATGLITRPTTLTGKQLLAIVPLAIVHTLGNLLTNVSLGKVAVSFTHTIKAMEPFFLRRAIFHLSRRCPYAAHHPGIVPHCRGGGARVRLGGVLQLDRLPRGHGVQSYLPIPQRALQEGSFR